MVLQHVGGINIVKRYRDKLRCGQLKVILRICFDVSISQLLEIKIYVRACSILLLQDIPDKFMQHFRGLIAKSVQLESRCGHTFDVEVAKNMGKVVLQTGWKVFVTAHDLNMGDFLVFKYDGTSRLKVFIFDLSCCEKVPPCLVKRNHICGRETMHIENSSSCRDLPMNVTASSSTSLSDSSGYESP